MAGVLGASSREGFRPFKGFKAGDGRLERPNNRGLWRQTAGCEALAAGFWPECLVQAAARDFRPFKCFKAANGRLERPNNRELWRQTASCNALATKACGRSAWCKQPRGNLGLLKVLRLANGRLERPNNRGLWRQTAGCNARATKACGRSAWCKQRSSNKGLWPECLVQAAARDFRPFKGFKAGDGRLERPNNRGLWRQTAGCNALAAGLWPERLVQAAAREFRPFKCFKAANGRLERPNNRGLWRQTAGCNARATKACGRSAWCKQCSSNKGLWPECLVQAAAREFRLFRPFEGFKAGKRQA